MAHIGDVFNILEKSVGFQNIMNGDLIVLDVIFAFFQVSGWV